MSIIQVDFKKFKIIAHEMRRAARTVEFVPHDEVIMKQIPGENFQAAEASRQVIRDKYATLQAQIDTAQTVDELKALLSLMR